MGNFKKHFDLAKEKLDATITAYKNKQNTVVGDLAVKVVEQFVEADASKDNKHFGAHKERHAYCNKNFTSDINESMRKIWFAYGDLGYDGVNGHRAKRVMENLKIIIDFFQERFNEKIEPKINI